MKFEHMNAAQQLWSRIYVDAQFGKGFDRAARQHRYRRPSVTYRANGKRECARRRRQIAEGRLTTSNGLVENSVASTE